MAKKFYASCQNFLVLNLRWMLFWNNAIMMIWNEIDLWFFWTFHLKLQILTLEGSQVGLITKSTDNDSIDDSFFKKSLCIDITFDMNLNVNTKAALIATSLLIVCDSFLNIFSRWHDFSYDFVLILSKPVYRISWLGIGRDLQRLRKNILKINLLNKNNSNSL